MFFYASKLFWLMANPANFLILSALLGYLLCRLGFNKAGKLLGATVVVGACTIGFTQLPDWLLGKMETGFEQRQFAGEPFGIVILGGAIDNGDLMNRSAFELGDGAERILKGIELSRQYPGARIIFTGGDNSLRGSEKTEAEIADIMISAISDQASRFEYEGQSRNTFENAMLTGEMIGGDRTRPWLLVTSAFHMKRAMAVFDRAGFNVYPVAVDHRARRVSFPWLTPHPVSQFAKTDLWLHEMVGRIAYSLTGKT